MVPCFSNQAAAGRSKSANFVVSDLCEMSCTTTNFALANAFSTLLTLGMLTRGLVPTIQIAFRLPFSKASNISVADKPGLGDILLTPQKSATSFRCIGLLNAL